MKIDNAFHGISTLILTSCPSKQEQGTGFFYQQLGPRAPEKKGSQWRAIEKLWLVTNRHVVLPRVGGKEIVPDSLSFHLRKMEERAVKWDPIVLTGEELFDRARFHPNEEVDVCIVGVLDLITDKIKEDKTYLNWYSVSNEQLPSKKNISVEVGDDAVIIGYPRGFYDEYNVYPIVKSGIIASKWGAWFGGKPYFLIDAKLFPGSSGSIVVSKPINLAVRDGDLFYSKEKQFTFLSIFSGEQIKEHHPIELDDIVIIRKSGFNLGIVWYGHLVEEIIKGGQVYETRDRTVK